MIGKKSLRGLSMPKLKYLTKSLSWYGKPMNAISMVKDQHKVISTRIRIPTLKNLIALYPLIKIIVEMEANQGKLWVRPRRILV